jgi:hypothetical protein
MVAKLVDCEANKLTFISDLPLDVPTIEPRPKLDDGVEDGVDGS